MELTYSKLNNELIVQIKGRIDSNSAPQLEEDLMSKIKNIKNLTLDFKSVDYISSAGLRVILALQKIMADKGNMTLINVPASVKEIFDITGFSAFLSFK